jgi:arabinoxylan arabinofuranohydrolase
MKSRLLIISLIISIFADAQNPICPPGLNIADPTARVWPDGRLYVYGSRDDNPKSYCSSDHWVLSTDDLINWKYQPNAFNSKDISYKLSPILYAPCCMYKDGLYYLYYCQPGKKLNEGVATSTSPTGPFGNAKALNIPARFSQIDPGVFIDDDGQAYYTWGQFSAKIAKLKPSMTEIDTSTIVNGVLTEKEHYFHEGNSLIKRNGIYYMVYAHNAYEPVLDPDGKKRIHPTCIGYATAKSPMGPYTHGGIIINNQGCNPGNHNNHGSIVEFKGQWYVFYHRSTHGSKMMRKACIEPIRFLTDGSIPKVQMTSQGAGKPLDAFQPIAAERSCVLNGNVRIETVTFDANNLVNTTNNDALTQIKNGDYAAYKSLDFGKGARSFSVSVANVTKASKIILRADSVNGPIIGTCELKPSATANTFATQVCKIKKTSGVHELYFLFQGADGVLVSVDKFQFLRK